MQAGPGGRCPHASRLPGKDRWRNIFRNLFSESRPAAVSAEEHKNSIISDNHGDAEGDAEPVPELCCAACPVSQDNQAETVGQTVVIPQLWVCLTCVRVVCPAHLLRDDRNGCQAPSGASGGGSDHTGHITMSCHDAHVFCGACDRFLFPRELAGDSVHERQFIGLVQHWLVQAYGKTRIWWRSLPPAQRTPPLPGRRGLKNFGNTCFFGSTSQALVNCGPLRRALEEFRKASNDPWDAPPLQLALAELMDEYWGPLPVSGDNNGSSPGSQSNDTRINNHSDAPYKQHGRKSEQGFIKPPKPGQDPQGIRPGAWFDAVAEHALFGQYDRQTQEDANTLLLDVLAGLDERRSVGCVPVVLAGSVMM